MCIAPRLAIVAISVAMISGCAGWPAPTPKSGDGAPPTEPTAAVDEPRYSCSGPPGFPASVFDQPAGAELGGHPSAAALREALEHELPRWLFPRSGYWLVGLGPTRADYIAHPLSGDLPFAYASFENKDGVWALS
jgi:hypothetical protein